MNTWTSSKCPRCGHWLNLDEHTKPGEECYWCVTYRSKYEGMTIEYVCLGKHKMPRKAKYRELVAGFGFFVEIRRGPKREEGRT